MDNGIKDTESKQPSTDTEIAASVRPALTIDWELYLGYLENSDLSYDQKIEFVRTLWSIQVAWVDLGLGLHPVQQAVDANRDPNQNFIQNDGACGQNPEIGEFIAATTPDVLDFNDKSRSQPAKSNDRSSGPSQGGSQS